ncbi:MAG TPA: DUF167 domain-containing protein [bacterium]|nr:DUF167 domain-containing protein [Myxococcales bacterium]OQA58823.1 MAG: hypothetical protein BWY40_01383 [bacterium ADurb.Bin270]HPW45426.1 DUF167 domain-containing protein [bacterium]HQC51059.1 DUF167 domain-containing protein [bacterium]HQH80241.1 DUF167 domain-containing protein [bacterium]
MDLNFRKTSDGIVLNCRVTPRAKKSAIKGERLGVLQVALNAPPVDGKANEELIRLLSKSTGIPKSRILIIKGLAGRDKSVLFQGVTEKDLVFK